MEYRRTLKLLLYSSCSIASSSGVSSSSGTGVKRGQGGMPGPIDNSSLTETSLSKVATLTGEGNSHPLYVRM